MAEDKKLYKGEEKRDFLRFDYISPIAYKVCHKDTISKLMQGYTSDISQSGILCNIQDKVKVDDILWLAFDRSVLNVCEDLEKRCLIYQNGIIGKVVRIEEKKEDTFSVGVKFVTREEKNLTNIYPKVFFLEKEMKNEKK